MMKTSLQIVSLHVLNMYENPSCFVTCWAPGDSVLRACGWGSAGGFLSLFWKLPHLSEEWKVLCFKVLVLNPFYIVIKGVHNSQ